MENFDLTFLRNLQEEFISEKSIEVEYQGIKKTIKDPNKLKELEKTGNYICEPKIDGIWVAVYTNNKGKINCIQSRHGKEKITKGFKSFLNININLKNSILIGEIITTKSELYIFDIIKYKEQNIKNYNNEKRRKILEKLNIYKNKIKLVPRYKKNFLKHYKEVIKKGEGVVIKKIGSGTKYKIGRTEEWLKAKKQLTVDYIVMDYEISTSKKYEGLIKAIKLGIYKNNKLIPAGKVGNMTEKLRKYISDNKEKLKGTVVEVGCSDIFPIGKPRNPFIVKLRPDLKKKDASYDKILILETIKTDIPLFKARRIAKDITKLIKPAIRKIETVGSIARNHPIVSDIDLVAIPKQNVKDFISRQRNINIISGDKKAITFTYKNIPVNLWLTDKNSFGATVLHFGAGKAAINLKMKAQKKKMILNRYGLFKNGRKIAGDDYKEILNILDTNTKFNKIKMLELATEKLKKKDVKYFLKIGQFPREARQYYRFRQRMPEEFKANTFTTKRLADNNIKVFGILKNGNHARQSIMINKDNFKNKKEMQKYLDDILKSLR